MLHDFEKFWLLGNLVKFLNLYEFLRILKWQVMNCQSMNISTGNRHHIIQPPERLLSKLAVTLTLYHSVLKSAIYRSVATVDTADNNMLISQFILTLLSRSTVLHLATRSDSLVPRSRLKFGERAFSVAIPKAWNNLPPHCLPN